MVDAMTEAWFAGYAMHRDSPIPEDAWSYGASRAEAEAFARKYIAALSAEPAAQGEVVHQYRHKGSSDWYDGVLAEPDAEFETRTLYTARTDDAHAALAGEVRELVEKWNARLPNKADLYNDREGAAEAGVLEQCIDDLEAALAKHTHQEKP